MADLTSKSNAKNEHPGAAVLDFGADIAALDIELEVDNDIMPGTGRIFPMARLVSLFVLGAVSVTLFHIGRAGYYLATDMQVAPFMLTPDSDAITQSRLSLTGLTTERESAGAHREVLDAQLSATHESIERLRQLHTKVESAVGVAQELTVQSERTSQQELQKLRGQKAVIDGALAEQQDFISEVNKRVESGLAHGTDLVRERSELRRLRLLQLQRERDEVTAESRMRELSLNKASQHGLSGKTTPETLRLEEQLLRLDIEIRSLEADERGKSAELSATVAQTARLDGLIEQLEQRPLYRAINSKQTLAFVPYTQRQGVFAGTSIYECRLWSVFYCQYVGRIKDVLPGEVDSVDPWGAPARGEYALMELSEPSAIAAKTLRVRKNTELSQLWNRFLHFVKLDKQAEK